MSTLELTIPAPCDWLNSNQRLHWTEKARRTRIWRYTAHGAVLVQAKGVRFDVPVHITMTIYKTRAGRYDVANYGVTAKAIVDGLVDSGLLEDDDNTRVVGPDMRAGEKRAEPCVVVRVEAIS